MSELIGYAAWILGIPLLVRRLCRRKVTILLYHDPLPAVFEEHLRYLSGQFNIISFLRVVDALDSGDWSELPDNPLVLHLDDGYRRNHELVPICKRHNVKPTLYLCSDVVATYRRFWSKLSGGRSKHLRLVDNRRLLEKLKKEADYTPDKEFENREALSSSELAAMRSQFDFQSHGRYHFSLLTLDDAALSKELGASRSRVAELAEQPCTHFSFPYGDYSEREIFAVKQAGYLSARTTRPGWVGPRTNPYEIPIVADVPGGVSVNVLRLYLTGLPRIIKRIIYVLLTRHIYAIRQRILMSRRFF